MTHSVPALVGVLLLVVLSAPAMTIAAGPTTIPESVDEDPVLAAVQSQDESASGDHIEVDNTTNRLALDREGANASSLATPSADLGAVFAAQDESLRYDYDWYVFEESFDDLSPSERKNMTEETFEAIEDGFEQLHDREQEVVAAHAAGEASDEELFRVIARNYEEARDLERAATRVIDRLGLSPEVRFEWYRLNRNIYTNSIRENITETVHGEDRGEFDVITVETTETGLTLATIEDGEYVRETTRYDNRNTLLPDRIDGDHTEISAIAENFYPWVFEDSSANTLLSLPLQLYQAEPNHPQVDLEIYFDGGTESVYAEHQRLLLSELPIEDERTWTNESLNVTLEETPANGPALVTTTDEDGEPVDATVTVDGVTLGETSEDGELWVTPPTGAYELTVESEDDAITVTVADE